MTHLSGTTRCKLENDSIKASYSQSTRVNLQKGNLCIHIDRKCHLYPSLSFRNIEGKENFYEHSRTTDKKLLVH